MPTDYAQHAMVFKAFCDETRLRILALLQDGELCACVLMERLGVKQPALSYHMKILVASGIVQSTPVGKWTHYRISEVGSRYALTLLGDLTGIQRKTAEYSAPASAVYDFKS